MRTSQRLMGIVVLAFGALSCSGDSSGPDAAACFAETASVVATVSGGASPVFNWTPKCSVSMLLVEDDGSDMWGISPFDEDEFDDGPPSTTPEAANRIVPTVTYGQVPAGMALSGGALPLVPGRSYDLVLWRVLPAGSTAQCQEKFNNWCLLTMKRFTR